MLWQHARPASTWASARASVIRPWSAPYRWTRPCSMSSTEETGSAEVEALGMGKIVQGRSGQLYTIESILSQRQTSRTQLSVYKARSQESSYVLKHIIPSEIDYQDSLQRPLSACSNLRVLRDTIPEHHLFVYDYRLDNLLQFAQGDLSEHIRRSLLYDALKGLAFLHDNGILHSDIKPNNVVVDYDVEDGVKQPRVVQIADLEDSVHLPPGTSLKGCMCGNQLWRSPESWARAEQNTSSDVFSFGLVCIYVMLKRIVFQVDGADPSAKEATDEILRRHISYFADEDGFVGLLKHFGEDKTWIDKFLQLASSFGDTARTPFTRWQSVDPIFRDLVAKMTNLDPARRITAREALKHPFFRST